MARKGPTIIEVMILVAIGGIIISIANSALERRRAGGSSTAASNATAEADAAAIEERNLIAALEGRLTPPADTAWKDGLAAVVLVDVSGSMHDRIKGERRRKIEAAEEAATDLVGAFQRYAAAHGGTPVLVGVYEFSRRNGEPSARTVVSIGPPNAASAGMAIQGMKTGGGTPIGDAIVEARLALDRTGLKRRHLLVVTDGENTDGSEPAVVARVLEQQKDDIRAGLYFVAFDVDANAFDGVKKAGGLLLSAKSSSELAATFEELLSDRILVEAPRMPVETPSTPVEPPKPPR
jgi:Mg-chelatase subunit ChlD